MEVEFSELIGRIDFIGVKYVSYNR